MKWPTGRHTSGSTGTGETPKMAARLDCICGHCTYAALDIVASGLFRLVFGLISCGVACGIKYALEMLKNALKSKLDSNLK